jgi:hypothetical protein
VNGKTLSNNKWNQTRNYSQSAYRFKWEICRNVQCRRLLNRNLRVLNFRSQCWKVGIYFLRCQVRRHGQESILSRCVIQFILAASKLLSPVATLQPILFKDVMVTSTASHIQHARCSRSQRVLWIRSAAHSEWRSKFFIWTLRNLCVHTNVQWVKCFV